MHLRKGSNTIMILVRELCTGLLVKTEMLKAIKCLLSTKTKHNSFEPVLLVDGMYESF